MKAIAIRAISMALGLLLILFYLHMETREPEPAKRKLVPFFGHKILEGSIVSGCLHPEKNLIAVTTLEEIFVSATDTGRPVARRRIGGKVTFLIFESGTDALFYIDRLSSQLVRWNPVLDETTSRPLADGDVSDGFFLNQRLMLRTYDWMYAVAVDDRPVRVERFRAWRHMVPLGPDRILATNSEGPVHVLDGESGEILRSFDSGLRSHRYLVVARDGSFCAVRGAHREGVCVISLETGMIERIVDQNSGPWPALGISPDGRYVILSDVKGDDYGWFQVWDRRAKRTHPPVEVENVYAANSLHFSADGVHMLVIPGHKTPAWCRLEILLKDE